MYRVIDEHGVRFGGWRWESDARDYVRDWCPRGKVIRE
jgi:hypothetical protein